MAQGVTTSTGNTIYWGGFDDILNLVPQARYTGWESSHSIPQAGKNHEEFGFFIRETGSEHRSTEFSGLRMRDGTPAQPCVSGTYASWRPQGEAGAPLARENARFFGRQLDRGEEDDIANLVSQTGTLDGSLHISAPTGRQKQAKIGFFLRETGSEQRSTEFSGLRMRDGAPAQPCTSGTYASWTCKGRQGRRWRGEMHVLWKATG